MKKDTLTNHFETIAPLPDNPALVSPIYQSVKFTFNEFSQMRKYFDGQRPGYFYSRYQNPTVNELECLLAALQGTEAGLAASSGIGAISTTLFALLKAGDQIVYFIESYKPTRVLIEKTLAKFQVKAIKLSLDDIDGITQAFKQEETRFVIWESPSNPQLKIPDNQKIISLAQAHQVTTILDNTFAGFHKNTELAVDIYLHSLTKYAGGHGDVMGGVILSSEKIIQKIHQEAIEIGSVLDPHAAFLLLRGMKTYHLRYQKQAQNALQVACWLEQQPWVEKVFYPGLPRQKMVSGETDRNSDYGTVLMFNFKDKNTNIEVIIDRFKLFQLSASLGSTESLVAPALYFYGGDLDEKERKKANLDITSIRLSLGIEEVNDLVADLQQAIES